MQKKYNLKSKNTDISFAYPKKFMDCATPSIRHPDKAFSNLNICPKSMMIHQKNTISFVSKYKLSFKVQGTNNKKGSFKWILRRLTNQTWIAEYPKKIIIS